MQAPAWRRCRRRQCSSAISSSSGISSQASASLSAGSGSSSTARHQHEKKWQAGQAAAAPAAAVACSQPSPDGPLARLHRSGKAAGGRRLCRPQEAAGEQARLAPAYQALPAPRPATHPVHQLVHLRHHILHGRRLGKGKHMVALALGATLGATCTRHAQCTWLQCCSHRSCGLTCALLAAGAAAMVPS